MVPFSTCLAISDLADTSIRIVSLTHLLLSFQSLRQQFHCGVFILLCFPYRRNCRRWLELLPYRLAQTRQGLRALLALVYGIFQRFLFCNINRLLKYDLRAVLFTLVFFLPESQFIHSLYL